MRSVVLIAQLTSLATGSSERLYLDAGALSAQLHEALRLELGEVQLASSASQADLRIVLKSDRELSLRIVESPDIAVAQAQFSLEHGLRPALRAVVLLIADAVDSLRESRARAAAAPEPKAVEVRVPEPEETVEEPQLRLRIAADGTWLEQPGRPAPGLSILLQALRGPWRFGGVIGVSGLGCCQLQTQALSGRVLEFAALADVEWSFLELPALQLSAIGRAGVQFARFSGRARAMAADGTLIETTSQSESALGGMVQLGLGLTVFIWEDLLLFLAAGAQLRPVRLTVAPPSSGGAIDVGFLGPWVQLGVGADFF